VRAGRTSIGRGQTPYLRQPGVGYVLSSIVPRCDYNRWPASSCMVLDPLGAQAVCRLGHLSECGGEDVLGECASHIFKI
jgi:hypothetical protein